MSFYAEAEDEFNDPINRRDNLWAYCKAHCDMDLNRAEAMYIREAAKILEKEYYEEVEFRKAEQIRREKEYVRQKQKEEYENKINERNYNEAKVRVDREIHIANSVASEFNPMYSAIAGCILSLLTFSFGLIEGADGFFSYLWRVPVALAHLAASTIFMYAITAIIRYHFISAERSKYIYISYDGNEINRFGQQYYFAIFSFLILFSFYFFG